MYKSDRFNKDTHTICLTDPESQILKLQAPGIASLKAQRRTKTSSIRQSV